jgi:hypothetical protein
MSGGILSGVGVATAMTLAAWLLVLFYFDPTTAGIPGLVLFFVSLAATLGGLLTLLLHWLRRRFQATSAPLAVSMRQAALLALAVSGILLLLALGKLNWWNGAAIVVAGLVVESYALIKPE